MTLEGSIRMRTTTRNGHIGKHAASNGTTLSMAQREELRLALVGARDRLLHAHAARREEVELAEVELGDVGDVAEAVLEDRQRAALEAHDAAELREVEHALAKFDHGTYGLSETSGRPIRLERLLALPWARAEA
jgi:RNA polymerase-binding transcription factor DksA